MKNKLYILGIASVLLILAGSIFKIEHWPGAGMLLLIGFSVLVLAFMPFALLSSYRSELDKRIKTLYIIAYICVFIECWGTLFKIQHWPGAGFLMFISIPLPFVVFLPAYLFQIKKDKSLNYNNLLLVLFFFAYFATMTALLALNVSRNVIDEYLVSAVRYDSQQKLTSKNTEIMLGDLLKKENNTPKKVSFLKIQTNANEIFDLIDKMKQDIIKRIDPDNKFITHVNDHAVLTKINGKDNRSAFNNDDIQIMADDLENKLTAFKASMLTLLNPSQNDLATYIDEVFMTGGDWKNRTFETKLMISVIDRLNAIKSNVAFAESETIASVQL